MKLSIIIPCFNEEKIIFNSYKTLTKVLEELNETYEIIFCNDGSTDNTLKILNKVRTNDKKVRVLSYFPNKGPGYASRQLYNNASGEVIIQMDADLAMAPTDTLPLFLKEIKTYDLVIASRYAGIKANYPLRRAIISKLNLLLNKALFNYPFKDINSGFFAIRKKVLDSIRLNALDFEIYIELFLKAKRKNFKIKEVPIKFIHKIESGEANVLKHGLKTLIGIFKLRLNLEN